MDQSSSSSGTASMMLPEIRTMSPIQPLQVPGQSQNESLVTASSVTSHDTFMTALTSSPASPASPSVSRLTVAPPYSLRKSISVDSFIANRRSPDLSEAVSSSSLQRHDHSRPEYSHNNSPAEDWSYATYDDANGRHPQAATNKSLASRIMGRTRGHSLSGPSAIDLDDPYMDDSEHERNADMAQLAMLTSSQRAVSASSPLGNGFSKGKARARTGDALLLPPRVSSLSSSSSIQTLNGSSITDAATPPVPPISPNRSRRPAPNPLVLPRMRSGSLATKGSSLDLPGSFTVAVVGARGCGKTTMIRKGLRTWNVGEEIQYTIDTQKGRLRYGSRTINAARDDGITATILEVDSDAFRLDTPDGAWPEGLPLVDGVLVLYDANDKGSFARVPDLLDYFHKSHLSIIAVACKCDLEKKISPHHAAERSMVYNVGLVEVCTTDVGKRKMRSGFQFLFRAINSSKRGDLLMGPVYRNPASPDVLIAPWSDGYEPRSESRTGSVRSRSSTLSERSLSLSNKFPLHPLATSVNPPPSPTRSVQTPTPRPPSVPTSPTRVKSTNDLVSEVEKGRQEGREQRRGSLDGRSGSLNQSMDRSAGSPHDEALGVASEEKEEYLEQGLVNEEIKGKRGKGNDPPAMPWATLEELLDKLFFLAVSGDDPTFITHFFMTYRKFATPRSILLGMQKRIRQLSRDYPDLLLGSYAQMRICDLLEEWVSTYPNDFATPGTHGAIAALVKQIASNPCTLHYAADILPFLDQLPSLEDMDSSWSMACKEAHESDDDEPGFGEDDSDDSATRISMSETTTASIHANGDDFSSEITKKFATRGRKGSLPLSTKSIISTPLTTTISSQSSEVSRLYGKTPGQPRNSLKELVRLSQGLATYDSLDVAQQITKMQSDLFLAIEPRQWLRYAMTETKVDSQNDPISAVANLYNQLAYWVSSLILAHDKVRAREKQVERFVELAGKLRTLNNYVGLRAVMTGINNATFPNDEIMTMFRDSKIKHYQQFLGWEILLNSQHNHRAYRLALRHTIGPAIPDMEVHTFDMVRANESNPNYKPEDPSKIHWGKFTLMARMITMLQGLQEKIRTTGLYDFPERTHIRSLLENDVMDLETIQSRVFSPPDDAEPIFPLRQGPDSPNASRGDAARFRRLFFW
ncbi:ras guanine nucleotide exchange factor domain-containing protein [Hysterangium stoloniferum]|nr:ras guanine nucleotide exchange factor domain-containing protein [Hysterangium stoloniferum]